VTNAIVTDEKDSPCIHVCLMDYAQGLCIGCHRTLDEITHWINYSPVQKQTVLAQIETRRAAMSSSN
jgi:predicted Fe-S protein YdhL (DUF1289 family)